MKKTIISLGLIVAAACVAIFLVFHRQMPKFDNQTRKEDVITQKYTPESVDALAETLQQSQVDFSDLEERFRVECLRQTHQGYYAVLLQTDGSTVFVFMDGQLHLTQLLRYPSFYTKNEFEKKCLNNLGISIAEMDAIDPNTLAMPTSAIIQTAHIVQEGIVIVTYRTVFDGKVLKEPILDSVEFLDNATIATQEKQYELQRIPYILEIDKCT